MESLPFGVVTAPEGGAVVFVWRNCETAPRRFIESLLKLERRKLPSLLVQFMFAYVENTYFSAQWWESLSELGQEHINLLAGMSNAYYTEFSYLPLKLVPWKVTDISIDGVAATQPE